ncbi:MAG TPA: ribonuclease P protein component, partial [Ktedonobacterales bacterium]|nr:ribonuclease P protein component [Ktedonobacterales bacterium]
MAQEDRISVGALASGDQLKLRRPPERTLSGERLRRAQRLRSPRDFQRVRAQGRRVSGTALLLGYVARSESDDSGLTRIGFSVSRRVGGAVARNRVKRRLREVMRRKLARIAPGYDLVITARPGAADARMETLEQEVARLLARV